MKCQKSIIFEHNKKQKKFFTIHKHIWFSFILISVLSISAVIAQLSDSTALKDITIKQESKEYLDNKAVEKGTSSEIEASVLIDDTISEKQFQELIKEYLPLTTKCKDNIDNLKRCIDALKSLNIK